MKYKVEFEAFDKAVQVGGGFRIMDFDVPPKLGSVIKIDKFPYHIKSAQPLIDEVNNLVPTSEMIGIEMVINERMNQLNKGRTPEHDAVWNKEGQLITAARRLLAASDGHYPSPPLGWNQALWEKMLEKSEQERKVIAAALIIADLDRLNMED